VLGLPEIFGGRHAFGHVRPGAWAICLLRGCLQATQNPARKKGAIKMGPAAIPILQVVCLVFVVIAIASVWKVQRNMNEITKYSRAIGVDLEARLKKVEDVIVSLQRRKVKQNKGGEK